MKPSTLIHSLAIGLAALTLAGAALAVEFTGSGFLTLAAGKTLSKETPDGYTVVDYGQGAIYNTNQWKIGPDSKLGLQGIATFNPQWSLTAQAVFRGAANGKADLEWLYATWQASDDITVQIGRKRLPLFYYSESQDIGLSLPWARLPSQAYGWDVVNFNGANVIYHSKLGDWNSSAEVFYGNETRKNNPYLQIYSGPGSHTDESWKNIAGVDWTLAHDWLELRFSAVQSYWQTSDPSTGDVTDNGRQSFLSAAAIIDYEDWVVRSEYSKIDRPKEVASPEHDWALLFGVGYRFGKWLPMITHANYHGNYTVAGTPNERIDDLALSLRYDLTASSDIKAQFDILHDHSEPGINTFTNSGRYGNAKMITFSYDMMF